MADKPQSDSPGRVFPDLPKVGLRGPFWSAEAEVAQVADPVRNWAFRTLFLDTTPRPFGKDAELLLPGTMLVLCGARSVTLAPAGQGGPTYAWTRPATATAPAGLTPERIRALLSSGELALLLVRADPADWTDFNPGQPDKPWKARFAVLDVLAGDLSLDRLVPQAGARERVYAALGLSPADPGARGGAARLLGQVTAHASGLSLFGRAALPWQDASVAAPFLLARRFPDSGAPAYRLTVEAERMTPAEREALSGAWGRLASYMDPANPASRSAETAPAWATLEVADPAAVPSLRWEVSPWREAPAALPLHFGSGEVSVILADQQPYAASPGPTSLARAIPADVRVTRSPAGLLVEVRAGAEGPVEGGSLVYEAIRHGAEWREGATLAGATLAFSPVETPRLLRDAQRLEVPEWVPGDFPRPVDPAVLWAAVPLEDGWAQLPVPNLTEQAYLDAGMSREPAEPPAVLQGAVAFGNDKPGATRGAAEQPWSLTLVNAARLEGRWELLPAGAGFRLARVEVALRGPDVVLNGLLWLSAEAPTAADALPALEDWAAGLVPVALGTVRPGGERFPPVATAPVESLSFSLRRTGDEIPSAALGAWSLGHAADGAVLGAFVARGVLPGDAFSRHLPLVWRRHPSLPMVQALPLTQSLAPPNHPARSRQMVPFELAAAEGEDGVALPGDWRIGAGGEGIDGAAGWPRLLSAALPAREWAGRADLPLVSLSLPGVVLDPALPAGAGAGPDAALGLGIQLRWDLPYTDEPNALAQLPKTPLPAAAPRPERAPDADRVRPLTRETLGEHVERLSERASLAAADAAAAFRVEDGATVVRTLVEPLPWPVRAAAELAAYPGTLLLGNAGDDAPPLALSDEGALKGVSGRFVEAGGALRLLPPDAPAEDGEYAVTAGSLAALRAAGGAFRDQRGLFRGASAVSERVVRTPVRLHEEAQPWELVTLRAPAILSPAEDAEPWRLWFRDLPAQGGSFHRERTRSGREADANDPEAGAREVNHLNGWEWRVELGRDGRLPLFGLHFYPLSLERVELENDRVRRVEMIGRLQLPVPGGGELPEFGNAVRATFEEDGGGRLALSALALERSSEVPEPVAEWPLALSGGEAAEAPRLAWTSARRVVEEGRPWLILGGAELHFFLFGARWTVPLAELRLDGAGSALSVQAEVRGGSPDDALSPRLARLSLDPAGGLHAVSFVLGVRLGALREKGASPATLAPAPARALAARRAPRAWHVVDPDASRTAFTASAAAPTGRAAFTAEVEFVLLGEGAGRVAWTEGRLFDDLLLPPPDAEPEIPEREVLFTEGALQFAWKTAEAVGPGLQLLPGMHVDGTEAPGFATVAFAVSEDGGALPEMVLRTAFVEAALGCRWGAFLQDGPAGEGTRERVFGSSAGELVFGYTARAEGGAWGETLLASGMLEVKNLVSWPLGMAADVAGTALTLPAVRKARDLSHARHTLRLLINQHRVPADVLLVGAGELLFDLAEGRSWQFPAVAEHQLVETTPSAGGGAVLANDRRWTAVQEVRLCRPAVLKQFLLGTAAARTIDPSEEVAALGSAHGGYLGAGLRTRLAAELDRLREGTLVVESTTPLWVRQRPVETPAATALQYLPGGTQAAVLSGPQDYAPSDPGDPDWLLLEMPFLGRLQHRDRDDDAGASPLQADPVLVLQAARGSAPAAALPDLALSLAAWADAAPLRVAVSGFDGAVGRGFARLDPLSLEEGWFRVQNPLPEPAPAHLQSLLAALPATAARLGRPTALARALEVERATVPPSLPPAEHALPADPTGSALLWRPAGLLGLPGETDRSPSAAPAFGWLVPGFQLLTSRLWRRGASGARRTFPAATVLPAWPSAALPLALAVAPYLSLSLRPARGTYTARLVFAELLALNPAGEILPVASRAWEVKAPVTRADVVRAARVWARESHALLAPESPVALLRFRELNEFDDATGGLGEDEAPLTTTYAFALVDAPRGPSRLARRAFAIRSAVPALRFRDGRFGGGRMPGEARPFELAPPQTVGVQPICREARPEASAPAPAWPWGMSALGISVRYAEGGAHAIGPVGGGTPGEVALWWQAPRHALQFRSRARAEGPVSGLPKLFRAPAMRSLLPVLPDPPLPVVDAAALVGADLPAHARWQPVLPGTLRYLLTGARPGAMLSLRHQLLRQGGLDASLPGPAGGDRLVSGSVPVQHRVPRPVPLPPNASPEHALRPWASAFAPRRTVLATPAPADEAFFAGAGEEPARRVRMRMLDPAFGALSPRWDGVLAFEVLPEGGAGSLAEWALEAVLVDGAATYPLSVSAAGGEGALPRQAVLALAAAEREVFLPRLAAMRGGEVMGVRVRVRRAGRDDGFFQELAFALRALGDPAVPPPLEPRFAHFEDPEYNRRLASAAAHETRPVKTAREGSEEDVLRAVTLASDRREYNPGGLVSLRYDWDDDSLLETARITLRRVDAAGVVQVLTPLGVEVDLAAMPPARLAQLSLAALCYRPDAATDLPVTLNPGDSVQVELRVEGGRVREPVSASLSLDVVAEPVLPAPEAAYALLRRGAGGAVEAVRFAWGPEPARVEMVNPADLRTGIVRRRAVFHWTDTVRRGVPADYAVQKIGSGGATHFPGAGADAEGFVTPA